MIEEEIALEEEKKQRLANASTNRKQRNPDKAGGWNCFISFFVLLTLDSVFDTSRDL